MDNGTEAKTREKYSPGDGICKDIRKLFTKQEGSFKKTDDLQR